jgi:hypothetical protein
MWGHTVETAVFLENVTPTRKNDWSSAYELWFCRPFDVSRLCPFGCCAFVNIPKLQRQSKFSDTTKKGVMVGYQLGFHNWHILREEGKVELSHDITFDKTLYPGISIPDPAGLITPLVKLVKMFEETNIEPGTPVVHNITDSSDDNDESFERNLCPASNMEQPPCFSLADGHLGEASTYAPFPGFDVVLQPVNQKAPKDILSNIDEGNILDTCC